METTKQQQKKLNYQTRTKTTTKKQTKQLTQRKQEGVCKQTENLLKTNKIK